MKTKEKIASLKIGLYHAAKHAGQTLQKSPEHAEALQDMAWYRQALSKLEKHVVSLTTEPTSYATLP